MDIQSLLGNGMFASAYPYVRQPYNAQAAGSSFASRLGAAAGTAGHPAANSPRIVYMKTDDMLYSGGNGTGLPFYIKYAENSTEENPLMIAEGIDERRSAFEQMIHVKDISDDTLPRESSSADYGKYSMQTYLDFMKKDFLGL